ncbi:PTS glucose transporter subunit IIA [Marinilactibacillus sp. XAAS-LB27]|uniref:PTS sugar transporter subunit IIA n=1 Tax=Marinilactibacillus sp. XAAS-LB27 TaxID=3114538 RepID=UPI002E17C037|nr:PTS glucose transporter subunit IIA [Marinilactibacillus sp. XAAS-LB27]
MTDERAKDSEIEMNDTKDSRHKLSLRAVSDGEVLSIEEVPDEIFAQKMIGEGYAIKPTSQLVVAPIDGKLIEVADAKHAYYIETKEGLKILIHVGIDTLLLNGEGFKTKLKKDDQVKAGDVLVEFDEELITKKGFNTIISVIVLDDSAFEVIQVLNQMKQAKAGETVAVEIDLQK